MAFHSPEIWSKLVFTINPRIALPTLALAAMGALLGQFAQQRWPDRVQPHGLVVGGIAGVLLGLVLGLYLVQQRRRWIAVAVVAMQLILAYVYGGPWNALFAASAVAITLFISAGILRDLYNGSEWEAFRHHLRIWLSMRGGFVVVENGSVVIPSSPGPHFGPKLIIIRPGNATVLVSGSTISRICGPSIFMSDNFEYISKVVPLERQRRTLTLTDVLTSSHDPASIQLTYVFGIDVSAETIRGLRARTVLARNARGLTAAENDILTNLVTLTPAWDQEVHKLIQGATRNAIGMYSYEELLSISYRRLARQIGLLVRDQIGIIGCRLDAVTVAYVVPLPEIMEAYMDSVRIRTRHWAEGEGFRIAIAQVAAGYSKATSMGMSLGDIHREASRYMMEHMAEDPATKVVLTLANPALASEIQSASALADDLVSAEPNNGNQLHARG